MNSLTKKILFYLFFSLASVSYAAEPPFFVVIRHGEAEHNIQKIFNSNPQHPKYIVSNLTTRGRQQVRFAAENLKKQGITSKSVDILVVSPLPRTRQTASILISEGVVSDDALIIEDNRIAETKFYDLESMPYDIVQDKDWPGEPRESVDARIASIYHEMKNKYPNKNIIFVTHSVVGKRLLDYIKQQEVQKLQNAEFDIIQQQIT